MIKFLSGAKVIKAYDCLSSFQFKRAVKPHNYNNYNNWEDWKSYFSILKSKRLSSKVFPTAAAAVADITDGSTLLVGGFGLCG